MNNNYLIIKGAREKNLKNVEIKIPKNKLIVFSGISGSGKTSLAFSTIYNEGKRRYVESLSTYARQFLGNSEKPDVDKIEGLSPAIAINQKTIGHNPRSIVGTITEIYDYLRLLYARAGTPYCINGHGKIETMTIQQIMEKIKENIRTNSKITILSPIVTEKKGQFKELFQKLKREGFVKVVINKLEYNLDEDILLDKNNKHNIFIHVDKTSLLLDQNSQNRIYSSVETATKYGGGVVYIRFKENEKKKELIFSEIFSCYQCGFGLKEKEPRLFSFNTNVGACPDCKGIGTILDLNFEVLVPDDELSINQGGIHYYLPLIGTQHRDWMGLKAMCQYYKINFNKKVKELTPKEWNIILNGTKRKIFYEIIGKSGSIYRFNHPITGLRSMIKNRFTETSSKSIHNIMVKKYLKQKKCDTCKGKRLNDAALSVKIENLDIYQFNSLTIKQAYKFITDLNLNTTKSKIVDLVIAEIKNRLIFLIDVGLEYLTLNRKAQTLSSGEAQRIRLATQIGSKLTGIIYVLDEPSVGLHQYDNQKLIHTLKTMRDLGNTVIVVEHDEETIQNADWVVDIGVYGGVYGGEIVHSGTVESLMENKKSITGQFLKKNMEIEIPTNRRKKSGKFIEILEASENNLKNISLKIPLNKLVCITGLSGSGKSTLVNQVFYKGVKKRIDVNYHETAGKVKDIKNTEEIDRLIWVSQEPIGKTPRSNPATYTSVFTDIRQIFTNTVEAKNRGYKLGRFSFNVYGGRCSKCSGDGVIYHSMLFLPDVHVTCNVCNGKRYNQETLQIYFRGKNIFDVLNMEVDKAIIFFDKNAKIKRKLQIMIDIGLDYVKLGQPSTELSGGEAQRIKLATYLQKKGTGKTVYILDEPTTGLHHYDIKKLIKVLNRLVDQGETVILIEHNLELIKCVDHIIDLGPKGGDKGGRIIATGTPEEISKNPDSYTGQFLKEIFKNK